MKTLTQIARLGIAVSMLFINEGALAALTIPGADDSDGVFAPTSSTGVDLSLATTGSLGAVAGSGNGVYDPDRWAVVYRYSSVNIPAGTTVTFANHPSGAPVVWLVSGSVTINGEVNLNGQGRQFNDFAEPGPGGFRGGTEYINATALPSGGFGPGGGTAYGVALGAYGSVGSWGSSISGGSNGTPYGNARLLPLIGGSGGGGAGNVSYPNHGGGAGGGAIMIAAGDSIVVNGIIRANGGTAYHYYNAGSIRAGGSGSGGGIRVVSDEISGNGSLEAIGGRYAWGADAPRLQSAGAGRIRVEANSISGTLQTYPQIDAVAPDSPVAIWPPAEAPTVRVVSVGAEAAPADPHAELNIGQADISLENTTSADVLLETSNVDPAANVTIRVVPKHGQPFVAQATFSSGTTSLATWVAAFTPPDGFFAIQAQAINP